MLWGKITAPVALLFPWTASTPNRIGKPFGVLWLAEMNPSTKVAQSAGLLDPTIDDPAAKIVPVTSPETSALDTSPY
jgi:hypothetical protein